MNEDGYDYLNHMISQLYEEKRKRDEMLTFEKRLDLLQRIVQELGKQVAILKDSKVDKDLEEYKLK